MAWNIGAFQNMGWDIGAAQDIGLIFTIISDSGRLDVTTQDVAEFDVVQIPFSALYSFSEEIELDEVLVRLEFYWNEADQAWMMNVYDSFDELIVAGVKLVLGYDLWSRYTSQSLPGGKLMVLDPTESLEVIGLDDFNNERGLKLIYLKNSNF